MNKSYNSLYNSLIFEKFNNKLFIKGKKEKYLKYIFKCFKNLKKSKIKPKIFFFLILKKLKPIFFFSKSVKKKKKKKTVFYKPILLLTKKRYLIGIKWLLLPLQKKYKKSYVKDLEICFLNFINFKIKNIALLQKKKTYLIILKYKRFLKL